MTAYDMARETINLLYRDRELPELPESWPPTDLDAEGTAAEVRRVLSATDMATQRVEAWTRLITEVIHPPSGPADAHGTSSS